MPLVGHLWPGPEKSSRPLAPPLYLLVIQQMDDGKVLKRFVLPMGNDILGGWSPDSREFGFGGFNPDDPMPCIILDVETGVARFAVNRTGE